MKNEHAGAIKGLSIAVVVLSAIGIIGAILIMVFSGLLSAVLLENGPEIAYHLEFNDNGTITGGGTAFDSEDAFFLSMLMMLVGGGVAIWALICCIVALIAGIFGIMPMPPILPSSGSSWVGLLQVPSQVFWVPV